jgi:hypothetical protein
MRDLKADLDEFNQWMCDNYDTYDHALIWFIRVLPEAINRAIKAEAEVERLVKINQGCEQEAHMYDDVLQRYKAENAKLRKVVEAARGVLLGEGEHLCSEFEDAMDRLEQSLTELDKEGTVER